MRDGAGWDFDLRPSAARPPHLDHFGRSPVPGSDACVSRARGQIAFVFNNEHASLRAWPRRTCTALSVYRVKDTGGPRGSMFVGAAIRVNVFGGGFGYVLRKVPGIVGRFRLGVILDAGVLRRVV